MRVCSIMPQLQGASSAVISNRPSKIKNTTDYQQPIAKNGIVTCHISFTGNTAKNVNQAFSYSAENNFVGLDMYKIGGVGMVTGDAPPEFIKSGMDMREVVPYHSTNNADSGVRVVQFPKDFDLSNLDKPRNDALKLSGTNFFSVPADADLNEIAKKKGIESKYLRFVAQDPTDAKGISKFQILERENISGSISRIDEKSIANKKDIKYTLFKMINKHSDPEEAKRTIYFIHTDDLAKAAKAYSYGPAGGSHPLTELFYRDSARAAMKALPKITESTKGSFNPANVWVHCRTAFAASEEIIDSSLKNSYFRGMIVDNVLHNPGHPYQGVFNNPLEFIRYKATEEDWAKLTKNSDFKRLVEIDKKGYWNATNEEQKLVKFVLDPFLKNFVDSKGDYNLTMTPIAAAKLNPASMKVSTVSPNFNNEMRMHRDITESLMEQLQSINTIGIKNGLKSKNLKLDKQNEPFGRGGNILSADTSWYNPYNPEGEIEDIYKAKQANKENLLNLMGEAYEKEEKEGLKKLFFNPKQVNEEGMDILGNISKFKKGDMLTVSWGRADWQKGMHITLGGFYKFLMNPSVTDEVKKHSKLLVGGGVWSKNDADYKSINYYLQKIKEAGYEGNACYVDGYFPNRLGACADFDIFTSRYEPDGLTGPEGLKQATPVSSINTGGNGDALVSPVENKEKANGFKTKDPYMMDGKEMGLPESDWNDAGKLHAKRTEIMNEQVANLFKQQAKVYNEDPALFKKMMANAAKTQLEWNNNGAVNGGKCAIDSYKYDIWEVDKGWENRNKSPLQRLVGEFGEIKNNSSHAKTKMTKMIVAAGIGLTAVATGLYLYFNKKKSELAQSELAQSEFAQSEFAQSEFAQSEIKNASETSLKAEIEVKNTAQSTAVELNTKATQPNIPPANAPKMNQFIKVA